MNPRHTLTGQLAGGFIESKLTLVLMIAALIFGIWAVLSTPREENPQISMPAAAVQAVLPGAEPDEMEAKVIRPLEAIINQIPGVDHYWSTAVDSAAVVVVQFKVGEQRRVSGQACRPYRRRACRTAGRYAWAVGEERRCR